MLFVAARISATADGMSLGGFATAFADHNLIYLLAYVALASRAWQIDASAPATRLDVVVVAASALTLAAASIFGIGFLDGPIALSLGLYFVSTGRFCDLSLRAAGVIFVAIGCNLFVGKIILMAFQAQVVSVDAFVVQQALWLTGDAAPRVANRVVSESGFAISIVGACSAFQNISLMMLATAAAVMWVRPRFQRSDLFWLAIGTVLVVTLNSVRLGLMAQDYESYAHWHHGTGAEYIAVAQTALVILVAFFAAQASRTEPPREVAA